MHENILNFINTISISASNETEYANTIEIKRESDPKRTLANSGTVKVTDSGNEIGFVFDNDTGELLYMYNYKD
jgi:hypothetical protein